MTWVKCNVSKICVQKLVLHRKKFDSSKQALYDLHWLPIKARITLKLFTFMCNCSAGNAPTYLTELLSEQTPKRNLRSSDCAKGCYEVPFKKRKTFSDRSFATVGPRLWNSLLLSIRNSETLDGFKRNLKTFYFRDFNALF